MNFRTKRTTSSELICVPVLQHVCIYFHLEFHSHPVNGIAHRWAKPANQQAALCSVPEKYASLQFIYGLYNFCLAVIGFIVSINDWHFISLGVPSVAEATISGHFMRFNGQFDLSSQCTMATELFFFFHLRADVECSMLIALCPMNGCKYSHVLLANIVDYMPLPLPLLCALLIFNFEIEFDRNIYLIGLLFLDRRRFKRILSQCNFFFSSNFPNNKKQLIYSSWIKDHQQERHLQYIGMSKWVLRDERTMQFTFIVVPGYGRSHEYSVLSCSIPMPQSIENAIWICYFFFYHRKRTEKFQWVICWFTSAIVYQP